MQSKKEKAEYNKIYRLNNKDKIKEQRKVYLENMKESHEWRMKNCLHQSKARARRKGIEHTLTLEEYKELYPIDNKCPVFDFELSWGHPISNSPSLDRIDSNKGYTKENCQIISNRANHLKNDATIDELKHLLNYLEDL